MLAIMQAEVEYKLSLYPPQMQKKVLRIRKILLDVAKENGLEPVEESLKWGEPSYASKQGSAVRIGWHPDTPEKYGIYFHCQSKLVPTFRKLYPKEFTYSGNRAILFDKRDKVPIKQLKHCLLLALRYHKIKHLPLLGN